MTRSYTLTNFVCYSLESGARIGLSEPVCELLHEDARQRVLRCAFEPGVGHERHYHDAHFGYTIAAGRMRITDGEGVREVDLVSGSSSASPGEDSHEALNIGETTAVFLIVEPK